MYFHFISFHFIKKMKHCTTGKNKDILSVLVMSDLLGHHVWPLGSSHLIEASYFAKKVST